MTNSEVELLCKVAVPNKYLAQIKGVNISVNRILMPGNKYLYYLTTFDSFTNQTHYLHPDNVDSSDVFLLPIRKTLKQYYEKFQRTST